MDYFLILVLVILTLLIVGGALALSYLFAAHKPGGFKNKTYECGEETSGPSWIQFNVGFYLFALLFLVFDVEAAFLFPWAVVLRQVGVIGLIEVGIFVLILLVALLYAWRKGVLQWV